MITDQQVRKLRRLDGQGIAKEVAAARVGMDAKTARKYRRLGKLPSEVRRMDRNWRTRPDVFAEVWPELEAKLQVNPGLEAKTFLPTCSGASRPLRRRPTADVAAAASRAGGPRADRPKRSSSPRCIIPVGWRASDFTHCTDLGVTINGSPFDHMIYHFVLTYSNWETGTICFSESLESLSEGLQNALWELGGVPQVHRTDRLTAAVQPGVEGPESFKQRYQALLQSLRLAGPGHPGGQGQRERRRGAEPPPVQAGGGPGVDDAWQPGLHQPGQLRGVPAAAVRAAKRRVEPARLAEEVALAAAVAESSTGGVQAAACARGNGQHHPRGRATSTRWPAG